jgi:hypothetical protein
MYSMRWKARIVRYKGIDLASVGGDWLRAILSGVELVRTISDSVKGTLPTDAGSIGPLLDNMLMGKGKIKEGNVLVEAVDTVLNNGGGARPAILPESYH